jgi:hypothetical protein
VRALFLQHAVTVARCPSVGCRKNHGGGDTDREAALAARLPIVAVSGGQADTAHDAIDPGDQADTGEQHRRSPSRSPTLG